MSTSNSTTKVQIHASQRRYPAELRERAVRMVREATVEGGESFGVVTRVARQAGYRARVVAQLGQAGEGRPWPAAGCDSGSGRRSPLTSPARPPRASPTSVSIARSPGLQRL